MPRRNNNNAYQGAGCSNILPGFGDGAGARSAEYIRAIEVQPVAHPVVQPVVTAPAALVCAWRYDACHGDVVQGRDLCEAHLHEVRARAATMKAKRTAS